MPTSSTAGAPSLRSVHATTTPMPRTHNCHSATGWIRMWCFVMQLKRVPVESRGACQYADACTTCFCWPAQNSLRSQVRRGNIRPTAAKTSNSSNNNAYLQYCWRPFRGTHNCHSATAWIGIWRTAIFCTHNTTLHTAAKYCSALCGATWQHYTKCATLLDYICR
jgi:hypothetical protein